jgi:predicted extracellular nuclease
MRLLHPLAVAVLAATALQVQAQTDLFFSEYVEGSSFNKALEIANATDSAIELSPYEVQIYFNGNTSAGTTIALSGVVEPGEVFVLADDGAVPAILVVADQTSTSNFFNGDDAVVLLNGGALVDAIGQVGVDPGSQWGAGDISTQNHTLRRVASVVEGDSDASDAFDPAVQWLGFAQDSFDGLGSHDGLGGGEPTRVLINEIDADTAGTDVAEFVELYDGGKGNTPLDGLVLVFYNGNGDQVYAAYDLDGYSTDTSGYWVAGNAGVANVALEFSSNGLQNGADAVALYQGDAVDFPSGAAISLTGLIDAVTYGTNDAQDSELLALLNAGQLQLDEGGSGNKDGHSNQRCENGGGGERNTDSFLQAVPTPGLANACEPLVTSACFEPATSLHRIQGAAETSPLEGSDLSVEAVVVGSFQGSNGLSGFYLQEEDGQVDDDPMTSEGVFVYHSATPVAEGDLVRVTGTVKEFYGMTQVADVSAVEVCAQGYTVTPAPLTLPVTGAADLEALEGMLVASTQVLTVSENYNLGRYGELVLSNGRLFNPTQIVSPGVQALAQQAQNDLNRITLDDGSREQNPELVPYPAPGLSAMNTVRGGDKVESLIGVMDYAFSAYRVHPVQTPVIVAANERPDVPAELAGNSLRVASFNVLNFFNGDGQDGGFPTARGADSAQELVRQQAKIVSALLAMNADVVGLVELENDGFSPDSAIAALVDALNAEGGDYAFLDAGVPQLGGDAIAVGYIYQPQRVKPVGVTAILDGSVDARFIDTKNRPVLIQAFEERATGERLIVAVNHFKSKGSDCDELGDPDAGDGQGNCNGTRTLAAEALVDFLATNPTGLDESRVLILGDLNAYAQEDPIAAIEAAGYSNLVFGEGAYSYVFYGQAGSLDHALASADLAGQVVAAGEWHINADEPRVLDYNLEFQSPQQQVDWFNPDAYRSSDHDPIIVALSLQSQDLRGDFNGDGKLNSRDLRKLLRHWGCRNMERCGQYDLSGNGRVDYRDYKIWKKLRREYRRNR